MKEIFLFLFLIAIAYVLFRIYFSRSLDDEEIKKLADLKRKKDISEYYSFTNSPYDINPDFKKKINPDGKLYEIEEELFEFPSIAASLLK